MPIMVTKVSEAVYTASITPPHADEPWTTALPLRVHRLCEELVARGLHQVDVDDAINDADRAWLMRKQETGHES
jgi:hypothetical protein